MASPQGSALNDRAIRELLEQLRKLLDSKQTPDPERRAYVVAYTYPSGMKPHEVTGKNFETELTEDAVRQLVPKLVGKKFATSHGQASADNTASFAQEPIEIGKIKDARLDESGCMVSMIELDTTPDALWTGQLIHDGLKPDVSLFYWIGPDEQNPSKLAIDLHHVCATTKGFHEGTQIIGYFQHASKGEKQKFRIFEPTLPRIGTVALSMILEAIKESRCTDALTQYVQAWQRNSIPDSMDLATEQPVGEPAPLAPTTDSPAESKPTEPATSAVAAPGNPEPVPDMPVVPEKPEVINQQPIVDLSAMIATLQQELVKLRESLQPKSEGAAVGLPAAEAAPPVEVPVEKAPESKPADAMILETPASVLPTQEVAAPPVPGPVTPKTKYLPTELPESARRAPELPTPVSSPQTSFASLGLVHPVGNSANFLRPSMSSGNPMSSMDTGVSEDFAQAEAPAPAAQHDLVADAPTPQPYTTEEVLELAAKGQPLDQARLLARLVHLDNENQTIKQEAEQFKNRDKEQREQMLSSLTSFLKEYQPELAADVDKVIAEGRENPDSPALRVVSAMAASAQSGARPESDQMTAAQRIALDALAQRQVHPPAAANNRYAPYPSGGAKGMANSASGFARGAVSQVPNFSQLAKPAQAEAPRRQLTKEQREAGLNDNAFSRQRGVLRTNVV